jgi:hypothetical protein
MFDKNFSDAKCHRWTGYRIIKGGGRTPVMHRLGFLGVELNSTPVFILTRSRNPPKKRDAKAEAFASPYSL